MDPEKKQEKKQPEETAENLKNQGNDAFSKGDDVKASQLYTKAIALCDQEEDRGLLRALYSNRSAARLRAGDYSGALHDANDCLKFAPGWSKGYARKGMALLHLEKFENAKEAFEFALLSDPTNEQLLSNLQLAINKKKPEIEKPLVYDKAKEEAAAAAAAAATASAGGDPLAAFFSEVTQLESELNRVPDEAKVTNVNHEFDTQGWNTANQVERILQSSYKFKNLNPFHVFHISFEANEEDLKQRYKKLSTLLHPDKLGNFPHPERAKEAFDWVKTAYDQFKNPERMDLLFQIIEECRKSLQIKRNLLLVKEFGGSEALLEQTQGPFEEALKKEVQIIIAKAEVERKRAEELRKKNEEALKAKLEETEPDWGEVKKEMDEHKAGQEDRKLRWENFAKRQKKA